MGSGWELILFGYGCVVSLLYRFRLLRKEDEERLMKMLLFGNGFESWLKERFKKMREFRFVSVLGIGLERLLNDRLSLVRLWSILKLFGISLRMLLCEIFRVCFKFESKLRDGGMVLFSLLLEKFKFCSFE